jgi:hypothetical protein
MANNENTRFSREEVENVRDFNAAFRNVNDEVSSLFDGLNSISDEIKGQVQGYQLANKAVSNLTGVFGKLKDIQDNIKTTNSKDLKTLQEKALSEKKNLEQSQRLLLIKATTEGLSEKEAATLANVNGLLEKQDGLYRQIESTLSQVIENEEIINKTTGTLGALTEGFGEGLKKAGFGALETKLGLSEALQNTKEMVAAGEGNVSKMEAAGHLAKQLGSNLMKSLGPIALIALAVEGLVNAFKETDKAAGDTAKNLGISYNESIEMLGEMNNVANASNDILITTEKLTKTQNSLNKMFGTSVQFSGQMAEEFASVQERLQLSDEAMASFTKLGLENGKGLKDNLNIVNKTLLEQNRINKTSFSQKEIQESIGKASAATRLQLRGSTEELTKAAVNAKKLGLEIEDLGKTSSALLDFESSISSELEAELMTGKDLNLERARAAALNGDNATLAAEMAKQIGTAADFGKMNVLQQEALAKAFGMGREDLAKMLEAQQQQQKLSSLGFKDLNSAQEKYNELLASGMSKQEAMKAIGDDQLANQLASVSQQEKLAAVTSKLSDLFVSIMDPLMPVLDSIMTIVEGVLKPVMKLLGPFVKTISESLIGIFEPISALFTEISDVFKDLFGESKELGDIWGTIGSVLGSLVSVVFVPLKAAISFIIQGVKSVVEVFGGIIDIFQGRFEEGLKKIVKGVIGFIMRPFQLIIDLALGTLNALIEGLNQIPGVDLPKLEFNLAESASNLVPLAKGGIVTQPTKALIGEAGPEAVVPLNKQLNINLDPLIEKVNLLISIVEKGGNVYLDGNKVGTAMAMGTFKTQ